LVLLTNHKTPRMDFWYFCKR